MTDSLGRFSIDSLAAGTYQVGVFHPLLEVYQPYETPAHFKGFHRGCVTLVAWRQARAEAKE